MGKLDRKIAGTREPASIAERAALNGVSFEIELNAILAEGRKFTPLERAEVASYVALMTPKGVTQTDSTLIIREMRDSNYGRG